MGDPKKKSVLVSVLTGSGELAVFSVCSFVLVGPALLAARWLVGATGASVNFVFNRRWAFEATHERKRAQSARFAVTALLAVSLGTTLFWAAGVLTHADPRALHGLSMGTVWVAFTYPMMKRWVFRGPNAT